MADTPADADARLKPWKLLHTENVLETPWFKIRKQKMETADGVPAEYFVHDSRDGVICVCVDGDGRIFVEKQYRPPVGRVSYDYPAGNMELSDNGDPMAAVRRELREELGVGVSSLRQLATLDMNPGFSNVKVHVFLAKGTVAGPPHAEATESIVPMLLTPTEILQSIQEGKISCTSCVAATYLAFRELGLLGDKTAHL